MKKQKQVFKFKDVIIASVVADRVNKGYIKESAYRYDNEAENYVPTSIANKNLMREMLMPGTAIRDEINALKMTPISANNKDFKIADNICEYIEGLALKALTDELHGYEKNIYNIYENDEVTSFDFGILASFPSSFKRANKKESLDLKINKLCGDNGYIGKVGDKVKVTVNIVNHVYSKNYSSHIYTGITSENNLVAFWSQKDTTELGKIGSTINVTAKVKRTSESRFYPGIKETTLNFVKKIAS